MASPRPSRRILVPAEIPPQVIKLSPRKPLHGRVVDSQGRPIPGAAVRSTTEFGNAGTRLGGRDRRRRPVRLVRGAGHRHDPPRRLQGAVPADRWAAGSTAGSDELTITLHRPQHLHGTVTDAETGRPIERFVLISGSGPIRPGWPPEWLQATPPGHSAAVSST